MNFFLLIAFLSAAVESALIANTPKMLSKSSSQMAANNPISHKLPRVYLPLVGSRIQKTVPSCKLPQSISQYLIDPQNIIKLYKDPIPSHYLNNSYFFDGAIATGNRVLCSYLARNGQQVNLLKENGDNVLVRLIEMGMSEVIGTLIQKHTLDTFKALHAIDASTGHTPLSMAIKLEDIMAVYEIVSPRVKLHDSPTSAATKRPPL